MSTTSASTSPRTPTRKPTFDTDVVVVGSGFGGSVSALRLTEKGYRVVVVEAGQRFTEETLPRTSWDLKRFLWAPALGMTGMQRITWLKDVVVLSGAGVGGGSMVYANTLYRPLQPFYDDKQWAHITDWRSELAPYYDQASRMLGVVENPTVTPSDVVMREVAEDMGVGHTYHPTPVGVYFGDPGKRVPDPYFGGVGPERTGCIECGNCMIGCRYGAKNRLDTNYLYLAERAGAEVRPLTTVTAIRPLPGGGWAVETRQTGKRFAPTYITTSEHVVLAAGTLGTQRLLHAMRDEGVLPRLSPRLGELTRTNSEALLGAMTDKVQGRGFAQGIAITSSFHPDDVTHIEPVRYGPGSNAMGLLSAPLMDGGRVPRLLKFLFWVLLHPVLFLRSLSVRKWSQRTIIALVMQTLDNSISVRRGKFGRLTSGPGHGEPNPTWIPVGHEAVRRIAEKINGHAGGTVGDLLNVPMTAHILGGCVIGDSPEHGVIDPYHRVFGYEGLHVVDGAAVSANLGVNPSLTITAQAERAMSLWPNKGDDDARPAIGEPYRRLDPVPPNSPVVPADAPGALRLLPLEPAAAR